MLDKQSLWTVLSNNLVFGVYKIFDLSFNFSIFTLNVGKVGCILAQFHLDQYIRYIFYLFEINDFLILNLFSYDPIK